MSALKDQHWLFGSDLLGALVAAGVVPPMTQRVAIEVNSQNFVTVKADIALSREHLEDVLGQLEKVPR